MQEIPSDFYEGILTENRDAVRAAVKEALLSGIKRQFEWEIPDAVKAEVREFITNEVMPQIRADLTANKDEFVNAATTMVRSIPAEIAKAMQSQLAANLTRSWTLRKVVDACFG